MREPYPLQQNFEFEKLKFKQSVELSQKVFEMMDGGKKIYLSIPALNPSRIRGMEIEILVMRKSAFR